jgi:hypothetical protein
MIYEKVYWVKGKLMYECKELKEKLQPAKTAYEKYLDEKCKRIY